MKRKQFEQRAQRINRRRGFTLIEVILALAIFMLGALAIVRIFPPALAAVQGSGSRTAGTRLATSAIERMNVRVASSATSSVPDAIYFSDPTFAGAFNGTVNRNVSLPRDAHVAGNGNSANDSALKIGDDGSASGSVVTGERQRVLQDSSGQLFALTNFSYFGVPELYVEDTVEGVRIKDNDSTNRYIFDFTNATLASTGESWSYKVDVPLTPYTQYPRPRLEGAALYTDTKYYISYKWIDSGGRVHGVNDEPYSFDVPGGVTDPSGSTPPHALRVAGDSFLGTASGPAAIVQGEVSVRMLRRLLPGSGPLISVLEEDARRGLIRFANASPSVGAGKTIVVSYSVGEWRTLMVDQTPINNSVTIPTRGLDTDLYGDEINVVAYNAPDSTGMTNNTTRFGTCTPNSAGDCSAGPPDALRQVKVSGNATNRIDFESGAIGLGALTAPRVRIAYRPEDGWGVQAAVAARTYAPYMGFSPTTKPANYQPEAWREYSWTTGSSNLYFPSGEAGKTVLVTFEYLEGSIYHLATDRIVTISEDLTGSGSAQSGFTTGSKVAVAELVDLNGIDSPNVTSILSVRGLSVQARAVWADNQGRYNQTVVTDYRKSS